MAASAVLALLAATWAAPSIARAANGYSTKVLSHNPLVYWRLGESSGTTVADSSGNNRNGTKSGTGVTLGQPGALDGDPDTSYDFAGGNSDYVYDNGAPSYLDGRLAVTVSVWVKSDVTGVDRGIITGHNAVDSTDNHLGFRYDASGASSGRSSLIKASVRNLLGQFQQLESSGSVQTTDWQHLVLVWSTAANLKLYINGVEDTGAMLVGGPLLGTLDVNTLRVGFHNRDPANWNGHIDEVAIFGTALTSQEVLELYNASAPQYDSLADGYSSNNPYAWWRLNEQTGASVAVDEIGNNHGTYQNGTLAGQTGAPVESGNLAANFDGNNDRVSAGTFSVSGNAITLLAWFRADTFNVNDARILSKATGTSEWQHYWMLSTIASGSETRLRFRVRTGGSTSTLIAGSGALSPGAWVFAAAVYDGSNMILYKDGVEVGRVAKSGALNTSSSTNVWIGDNPPTAGSRPFDGTLDEVAIFDHALSAAQIAAIYAAAQSGAINGSLAVPKLWGIDRDDSQLFVITDYQNPVLLTVSYGRLKWNNGGALQNLPTDIKALTIDKSGTMYLVNDSSVGSTSGPVLMTFNLDNASIISTNTVSLVGQMGVSTGVEGIALDEVAGEMYVLRSGYLYVVDPATGNLIRTVGQVTSASESLGSGRDLFFDAWGNLYVVDASDDEIYRVDRANGAILETYGNGNGNSVGYLRGAAWDHLNGRVVITDVSTDRLYYSTLSGYPNVASSSIGIHGLTNVEAIGFVPGEGLTGGSRVRVLRWREKR
jgi:hypothetical protein